MREICKNLLVDNEDKDDFENKNLLVYPQSAVVHLPQCCRLFVQVLHNKDVCRVIMLICSSSSSASYLE